MISGGYLGSIVGATSNGTSFSQAHLSTVSQACFFRQHSSSTWHPTPPTIVLHRTNVIRSFPPSSRTLLRTHTRWRTAHRLFLTTFSISVPGSGRPPSLHHLFSVYQPPQPSAHPSHSLHRAYPAPTPQYLQQPSHRYGPKLVTPPVLRTSYVLRTATHPVPLSVGTAPSSSPFVLFDLSIPNVAQPVTDDSSYIHRSSIRPIAPPSLNNTMIYTILYQAHLTYQMRPIHPFQSSSPFTTAISTHFPTFDPEMPGFKSSSFVVSAILSRKSQSSTPHRSTELARCRFCHPRH